jgi:hypothetical protein
MDARHFSAAGLREALLSIPHTVPHTETPAASFVIKPYRIISLDIRLR